MVAARRVACFRGASNLEEKLDDFSSKIKSANDTSDVVESALSWLAPNITRCLLWERMVCAYLDLPLTTNITSVVQRRGRTVKTVSAREIVCSFIPWVSVECCLSLFKI